MPGSSVEIRESYFSEKPKTFRGAVREAFDASITSVVKRRFVGHHLRVYSVDQI